MTPKFTLLFILAFACGWSQNLFINELDADTPGFDDQEFIELKSLVPNFSTNGYVLVFFNGSTNGGDASYLAIDLNGYTTDNNGLLVFGGPNLQPYPQVLLPDNLIQNGADAVALYYGSINDYPGGTLATQFNLQDALVYGTNDAVDHGLMNLLGVDNQYNDDGTNAYPKSIQRMEDAAGAVYYQSATPTPRVPNDGVGLAIYPVYISVNQMAYTEGETLDITFSVQDPISSALTFNFTIDYEGFQAGDYQFSNQVTIPAGASQVSVSVHLLDDVLDEGDEQMNIQLLGLVEPFVEGNNNVIVRVVDNDYTTALWGTPIQPTFGLVQGTQSLEYYDNLNGLSGVDLEQAIQAIVANPNVVRAQTYADVIDILMDADQNPENSNQVWLMYTEQGRSKLDLQTGSSNTGKWNREHTYPRSRGGFFDSSGDGVRDGVDVFWPTNANEIRHGNSDAHAIRATDAVANSTRGNQHYGQYTGPSGNLGSFKGDVARSVFFMAIRYNALEVVNGYPSVVGQLGDLATLLDWHRNDPPDDFEMHRNNVVYTWQYNRNPFIDTPDLVEYIWGDQAGQVWNPTLQTNNLHEVDLVIYPNPTDGVLNVKGVLTSALDVEVYSVEGRLLKHFFNVENRIALDLEPGLYLVKFKHDTGVVVKQIVVK